MATPYCLVLFNLLKSYIVGSMGNIKALCQFLVFVKSPSGPLMANCGQKFKTNHLTDAYLVDAWMCKIIVCVVNRLEVTDLNV